MTNTYDETLDAGINLKEKDHRRLIEYINRLASCTTKEEAQQIESFYSDLSDFRFVRRFVPDIDNSEWHKYKSIVKNILDKNINQFKHIYDYEPILKNLKTFKNIVNKEYTIKNFLQEASLCKTLDEYAALYKEKYNFEKMTLSYTSPTTLSLFTKNSELPFYTLANSPENKANLYDIASKGGYDLGFIPTPEEIAKNGISFIQEKIQDFTESMDKDFQKHEYDRFSSEEIQGQYYEPDMNKMYTKKRKVAETIEPGYDQSNFSDNSQLDTNVSEENYNKISLQKKHQYFVQNPYLQGTQVPSIGIRNEITGNIETISGYTFDKTENQNQTIVLSKVLKDDIGQNEQQHFIKISHHIYNTAMQNSLIIANAPSITTKVIDNYLEAANLDQDRQRVNTAVNFWHNYKAYCRIHCNNPQEAMQAAKHIITEMRPSEKAKFKKQIIKYQKLSNQSYNDRLMQYYHNSVGDKKIENFTPFRKEVLSTIKQNAEINDRKGTKLDNNCKIKIGDTIKMRIEVTDVFKKRSMIKLPAQDLILISTCKDNNSVVLSDKKGLSKYVMKLDDFTTKVQKLEKKNQRKVNKLVKAEAISYS